MGAMASQITSLAIVYSTVHSGPYQRKHQSSASLVFVRGIRRWPVNSPHKWPVTRKCFHLMTSSYFCSICAVVTDPHHLFCRRCIYDLIQARIKIISHDLVRRSLSYVHLFYWRHVIVMLVVGLWTGIALTKFTTSCSGAIVIIKVRRDQMFTDLWPVAMRYSSFFMKCSVHVSLVSST